MVFSTATGKYLINGIFFFRTAISVSLIKEETGEENLSLHLFPLLEAKYSPYFTKKFLNFFTALSIDLLTGIGVQLSISAICSYVRS